MPGFEIFGSEERREVMDVLDSGVLMRYGFDGVRQGHWKTKELEEALIKRFGVRFAHVCSSGTAALNTALAACGIGTGHEVIVPPFTFVADVEMILLAGAVPVFVDIDETLCLDPQKVESAIGPRTKAVLAVHMCGSMARIDRLHDICERHGLILIEDVAQAIGATFNNVPLGTFGKVGCFSFDYVKTVTCGEGGAIITNEPEVWKVAQAYTDHGHDHIGQDRGAEGHEHFGTNFRISELNAAVGVAQFRKLNHILAVQRAHKQFLKEALAPLSRIQFRSIPDPSGDSATFLSFMLPSEQEARQASQDLAAVGVDGCFYWYDNNWHYHRKWDHFKQLNGPAPLPIQEFQYGRDWNSMPLAQSDSIMGRTLSLLIKLSWEQDALKDRVEKLKSVLA